MVDFQIFCTKSMQIFKVKLGYFGTPFWQKLYIIEICSITLLVDKDPNFHLKSCIVDLDEK